MTEDQTARIRALNDRLRRTGVGGHIVVTTGVTERGDGFVLSALALIAGFNDFAAGSDPYAEHDFGAFELLDAQVFWKIDYYDEDLMFGAEDASDEAKSRRILTIMLANEY
jgi:hypothetical protein